MVVQQNIRWITVIAVILCFVGASSAWQHYAAASSPIPGKYRAGLTFPLYYPTSLPTGYAVDQSSFQRQDKVLIYTIATPKDRNIVVSQQKVPTDAPVRQEQNSQVKIPGERNYTVPAGHVHIGLWGDKYVADIIAEDTWIIINGTGFTADELSPVTQSFHRL